MNQPITITFSNCTHKGMQRTDNQDAYGKFPTDNDALTNPMGQLFIVADGMGGHLAGKEASQMAVRIVPEAYFAGGAETLPQSLQRAMESANEQIYHHSKSSAEFRGMGTTCTVLALKDDRAYVGHVGDSRAYRITRDQIELLTKDHSKVAEMQRLGILTPEEARKHPEKSHLYRALGIAAAVQVDLSDDLVFTPDDHFLLCTDGLAKVGDREIKKIVLSNSPQQACRKLIDLANKRGGADNVTIQVIRIESGEKARSFFHRLRGR